MLIELQNDEVNDIITAHRSASIGNKNISITQKYTT